MSAGFRTTESLLVVGAEGSMPRLYVEQQKLAEHFPQFRLVANGSGDVVGAAGTLCTNAGGSYEVRILLPSDYPYSMPKAEPVGWQAGGPHVYAGDSLCLMRARQWTPNMTIAFLVAKTALWLNKYEVWQRTGSWPGVEQGHALSDELRDFVGRLFE